MSSFDVAVIGGGPAGAACAITVARSGLRVNLIEADGPRTPSKIGEGLPPAATPVLRRLGIPRKLMAKAHLESPGTQSSWGTPRLVDVSYVRDPHGHGWHVDRTRFEDLLRRTARAAGAVVARGARVMEADRDGDAWRLHLRVRGRLARNTGARFLVDCTGRAAWLARREGIARIADDNLIGIARRYGPSSTPSEADARTLIESCPAGWWYTARVRSGARVVAFMTDADSPEAREALTGTGFERLLAETTHVRARTHGKAYRALDAPRAHPAESATLSRVCGRGWVAAGDAAASRDPLSSQGMLAALHSGMAAGEAACAVARGDPTAVEAYAHAHAASYAQYLKNRAQYYAMETRWPDAPFWRRRHEPPGIPLT